MCGEKPKGADSMKRELKENTADFGTIALENGKWFLRFRSWVSLATGEVYQERRSQKFLLGTLETAASTMTDWRTYALWTAAASVPGVVYNWGACRKRFVDGCRGG